MDTWIDWNKNFYESGYDVQVYEDFVNMCKAVIKQADITAHTIMKHGIILTIPQIVSVQ